MTAVQAFVALATFPVDRHHYLVRFAAQALGETSQVRTESESADIHCNLDTVYYISPLDLLVRCVDSQQ